MIIINVVIVATIFFGAMVNDILVARHVISSFIVFHFGFIFFIFCQSVVIAMESRKAHDDLEDFSKNLEGKVQRRTEELREQKEQMELLSTHLTC